MHSSFTDALARELGAPRKKSGLKYAVVEKMHTGERVVYRSDVRGAAETVAAQHAARRVIEE